MKKYLQKYKKELGIRRVLRKNNAMLPSGNFFVEFEGKERLASDKENEPKGEIVIIVAGAPEKKKEKKKYEKKIESL